MSKQLALTSAASIMAMAMLAVLGTAPSPEGPFAPRAEIQISAPHLPGLQQVLAGD